MSLTESVSETSEPKKSKRENPWISLLFNIAVPSLILMKASGPDRLGPLWGLVIALMFPLGYGLYDFATRRKFNIIAALGLVNVLMTGGIGLLKIEGIWFAVKEATIPGLIGIAVLVSKKMGKPLVKMMLYNDQTMNLEAVDSQIDQRNVREDFNRLFDVATWLVLVSFILSSIINFGLAYWLVKSSPGTTAFNEEVGYMNAISYPVILVCCSSLLVLAMWRLISGIRRLTGMELEQIIRT